MWPWLDRWHTVDVWFNDITGPLWDITATASTIWLFDSDPCRACLNMSENSITSHLWSLQMGVDTGSMQVWSWATATPRAMCLSGANVNKKPLFFSSHISLLISHVWLSADFIVDSDYHSTKQHHGSSLGCHLKQFSLVFYSSSNIKWKHSTANRWSPLCSRGRNQLPFRSVVRMNCYPVYRWLIGAVSSQPPSCHWLCCHLCDIIITVPSAGLKCLWSG